MDFGILHAHAHLYNVFWFLSVPSSNFSPFTWLAMLNFLQASNLIFILLLGKWRQRCLKKERRNQPPKQQSPSPRFYTTSPNMEHILAEVPQLYHMCCAESSWPWCIAESRKANSCCSLIWVKIVSVFSLAQCFRRDWQLGQTKSFHWLPSQ